MSFYFVLGRYYFFVEDDGSPVLIVVEPCDTEIQWKVTQHRITDGVGPDGSGESHCLTLA